MHLLGLVLEQKGAIKGYLDTVKLCTLCLTVAGKFWNKEQILLQKTRGTADQEKKAKWPNPLNATLGQEAN